MKKFTVLHPNHIFYKSRPIETIIKRKNLKEKSNAFTEKKFENSNFCMNYSISTSSNYSNDLRKTSLNSSISEQSSINNNSLYSNSSIVNVEAKKILKRKTKPHFFIIKENALKNKNLIGLKRKEEIEDKNNLTESEEISNNIFNIKYRKINSGRWSREENIKFIEAIVDLGKNWKKIHKYIGSRSSSQTRSHAQKFLLKMKSIKNAKFNINFSNIRNIYDLINEIKKGKQNFENNEQEKKYIKDTLISLNESSEYNKTENEIPKKRLFNSFLNDKGINSEDNLNGNMAVNSQKKLKKIFEVDSPDKKSEENTYEKGNNNLELNKKTDINNNNYNDELESEFIEFIDYKNQSLNINNRDREINREKLEYSFFDNFEFSKVLNKDFFS